MADVEMHEECGVFGIIASPEQVSAFQKEGTSLAHYAYWATLAQENRGRDAAGIATSTFGSIDLIRGIVDASGAIGSALPSELRAQLPQDATIAVGHNRYITSGNDASKHPLATVHPFHHYTEGGEFAFAKNGNLVNERALAGKYGYQVGEILSDSWLGSVITRDEMNRGLDFSEALQRVVPQLLGAYSIVATSGDKLFGVRGPNGIRPLHLGRLASAYVLASETGALNDIGAEHQREVEPGEMVIIDQAGKVESLYLGRSQLQSCLFEYVYFARPDQEFGGRNVREVRLAMGRQLAEEAPADADIVVGVPFSGRLAGSGYAETSGLPDEHGLEKVLDVRSFINSGDDIERRAIVRRKLEAIRPIVDGKRLVVVDDSIVRGNTMPTTLNLLREAGAAEIHVRIASPPVKWPCFYGVNMETRGELIAAHNSIDTIREKIGADSLGYLSLDGLVKATGLPMGQLCTGCFEGNYPTALPSHLHANLVA